MLSKKFNMGIISLLINFHYIMPITSQQIDGETMETVTDFIFLGSKITADGDYSHEIKRGHLTLNSSSFHCANVKCERETNEKKAQLAILF